MQADAPVSRRILARSGLFFFARVFGALATFALHWILTKWIGADEQGRYAQAFSWAALLTTLAAFGLPRAAIRFLPGALADEDSGRARGFAMFSLRTSFLLGVVIALPGVTIAWLAGSPSPLFWAFVCVPAFACLRVSTGILHGAARYKLSALPNNVIRPAVVIVIVASLWQASDTCDATTIMAIHAAVIAVVASGLLVAILRCTSSLESSEVVFEKKQWIQTAGPLLIVGLFTGMYADLNVAVVSPFVDDVETGVFFIAFRIAWLLAFVIYAVDQAILPDFSKALSTEHDIHAVQALVTRACLVKCTCMIAAGFGLALFGESLLGMFGNDDSYVAGYPAMLILGAAILARGLLGPAFELLSVTGHHAQAVRAAAVCVVATTVLHACVVPAYGIEGAATVVLVVMTVAGLWLRAICVQRLGVDPSILAAARRRVSE